MCRGFPRGGYHSDVGDYSVYFKYVEFKLCALNLFIMKIDSSLSTMLFSFAFNVFCNCIVWLIYCDYYYYRLCTYFTLTIVANENCVYFAKSHISASYRSVLAE